MSKIGKKIIEIPDGVEVKLEKNHIEAKGPKGTLSLDIHEKAKVEVSEKTIAVKKFSENDKSKLAAAVWGLTRSLINNMIIGVKEGYEKKLELQGVGFRMSVQGNKIVMALGFSHPVEVMVPEGINAKIEENNVLSITGIDKQAVGQFAAEIRSLKKAEPYKGKGFRYQGEKVRRKVGKKAGTAK
ncbi:MAG TPA: 50S ribosomal protein L6 [Candidatus Moranbacteria bacterium]|nr:50S ribosomal protein L6 [Candidatus Moranbacteria bacterium]